VNESCVSSAFLTGKARGTVSVSNQPSEDLVQGQAFPRALQAPRRSWIRLAENFLPIGSSIHEERFRFEANSREALTLHSAVEEVKSMNIICCY
jgi:hypothetical protein